MKKLLIILLTLTIISCKNKSQETISESSNQKDTIKTKPLNNTPNSKPKIKVDFEKNKDLLDIILLLPNSAFESWD
jgi:hypothetical protein